MMDLGETPCTKTSSHPGLTRVSFLGGNGMMNVEDEVLGGETLGDDTLITPGLDPGVFFRSPIRRPVLLAWRGGIS
jgi:hypothetical protein